MMVAMEKPKASVEFDCLREAPIALPVVCEPVWSPQMGLRLMRARKVKCARVDRRTPDWRHKEVIIEREIPCFCMSQEDAAHQLGVSQSVISRIEKGQLKRADISVPRLYSVFGEAALYILAGVNREFFEGKAGKNRRSG